MSRPRRRRAAHAPRTAQQVKAATRDYKKIVLWRERICPALLMIAGSKRSAAGDEKGASRLELTATVSVALD
jgi:hypothetical protein